MAVIVVAVVDAVVVVVAVVAFVVVGVPEVAVFPVAAVQLQVPRCKNGAYFNFWLPGTERSPL